MESVEDRAYAPASTKSASHDELPPDRKAVVLAVRKWGGSTCDAVLDPACKIFTAPNIEGIICYRLEMQTAVVFGDPICPQDNLEKLTAAFHEYCKKKKINIIYVTASQHFAKWAMNKICNSMLEIGEELSLDPRADPKARTGVNASLVRRKVRHAQNEGVVVHEYTLQDPEMEKAIEQIGHSWLKNRQGPQIHISNVRLFDDKPGKRWFFAQKGDDVLGVVVLNRLESRNGWHMNHLMIKPDVPNGIPELLVTTAIDKTSAENARLISFGVVPAENLGEITGFGKVSTWIARTLFSKFRKYFNLGGRKKFWEKFNPDVKPSYLLFSSQKLSVRQVCGLMKALNAESKQSI